MEDIWRFALEGLEAGKPTALIAVVENIGSVPGKTGTKLVLVGEEERGTVGGGISEKKAVQTAMSTEDRARILEFHHDGKGLESICSGSQKVAILRLEERDTPVLERIVSTLEGRGFGRLALSSEGIEFEPGVVCDRAFLEDDGGWSYREVEGYTETLTIVGGGHVCLALCRVMATLPFKLVVLDDRPGLEIMEANPFAHEKRVISYEEVARHVPQGERCYAVIMTHGHLHDELVVERLATGEFAYLGMMGSKHKVEKIYDRIVEKGVVSRADLERVRSPIGIPIGSHSPEEIAISIAAEIVAVKNGKSVTPRSRG